MHLRSSKYRKRSEEHTLSRATKNPLSGDWTLSPKRTPWEKLNNQYINILWKTHHEQSWIMNADQVPLDSPFVFHVVRFFFESNCAQYAIAAAGCWVASSQHGPAVTCSDRIPSFETLISYDSPKMSYLIKIQVPSICMGDFKSISWNVFCTWSWKAERYPTISQQHQGLLQSLQLSLHLLLLLQAHCELLGMTWQRQGRHFWMWRCTDRLRKDRSRKKFNMEKDLWRNSQNDAKFWRHPFNANDFKRFQMSYASFKQILFQMSWQAATTTQQNCTDSTVFFFCGSVRQLSTRSTMK